jgi:two-component system LytT family response regulator
MMLRVLIVDDEPPARAKLRMLLAGAGDIEVVGECGDGLSALRVVRERSPDLVFLDVQMPGLDGFGVLDALTGERTPKVVFVTAFDQYALKAFEVHALDYLLKPFDRERFERTLTRARAEVERDRNAGANRAGDRFEGLLSELRRDGKVLERIVVRDRGRIAFVRPDDIDWVEAAGNYVAIHCGSEQHLLRETMKGMEVRLDQVRFVRVHRSKMVNVDRIKTMVPTEHGEFVLTLAGGRQLQTGRGFTDRLRSRLAREAGEAEGGLPAMRS